MVWKGTRMLTVVTKFSSYSCEPSNEFNFSHVANKSVRVSERGETSKFFLPYT